MVEFLRKFENRGIKITCQLISYHQIYQFTAIFTLILYGCDADIFKLTATAQSINREVYGSSYPDSYHQIPQFAIVL